MLDLNHATGFEEAFPAWLESLDEPSWISEMRQQAFTRFLGQGWPRKGEEDWRYTSLESVEQGPHSFAGPAYEPDESQLAAWVFRGLDCDRLVFVDGEYVPELSCRKGLPEGVQVAPLREALREKTLTEHLGLLSAPQRQPMVALNTAFMQDGAFLRVPRNTRLERPVHLIFLGSDQARAAHPRNLILLEKGAEATVIESYGSLGEDAHHCNAVTEVRLAGGSRLDHYRLARENEASTHLSWTGVTQQRDSRYHSHEVSLGGRLTRRNTLALLEDQGAECVLDGLYLARGRQHMDHQTRVEHLSAHCNTKELYKGILDDEAEAVFRGLILVEQDAQKTDATQNNRNLLLSRDARVDSMPQLEIYADDVRCTHGSTTGQLDRDPIFFLRSRGIGEETARALLTYAFASEILEGMDLKPVHQRLSEELRRRLPQGESLRGSLQGDR